MTAKVEIEKNVFYARAKFFDLSSFIIHPVYLCLLQVE